MPVQDWNINTPEGYAGDAYGLSFTNSQRITFMVEGAMDKYGLAVQQGAKYNTCKVGHVEGEILGITMRENKLESAKRPGDGTVLIPANQPLAVMMEGAIQVKLATAISDKNIGISKTGEFGGVDDDYIQAVNVKAMKYPAAAGDIIPVMVNMSDSKETPAPQVPTVAAAAGVVSADASSADATVSVNKLFTFTNSTAGDYDFAVAPKVAGVSVADNGTVTVSNANTVANEATITATHKTQKSVTASKAISITPKSA